MNDSDWQPLEARLVGLVDVHRAGWICPRCAQPIFYGERPDARSIERHCSCSEAKFLDSTGGVTPFVRFLARRQFFPRAPIVLCGLGRSFRELWRCREAPIRIYSVERDDGTHEICACRWFRFDSPPERFYFATFEQAFESMFGRPFNSEATPS
jgi:hypothetical protein